MGGGPAPRGGDRSVEVRSPPPFGRLRGRGPECRARRRPWAARDIGRPLRPCAEWRRRGASVPIGRGGAGFVVDVGGGRTCSCGSWSAWRSSSAARRVQQYPASALVGMSRSRRMTRADRCGITIAVRPADRLAGGPRAPEPFGPRRRPCLPVIAIPMPAGRCDRGRGAGFPDLALPMPGPTLRRLRRMLRRGGRRGGRCSHVGGDALVARALAQPGRLSDVGRGRRRRQADRRDDGGPRCGTRVASPRASAENAFFGRSGRVPRWLTWRPRPRRQALGAQADWDLDAVSSKTLRGRGRPGGSSCPGSDQGSPRSAGARRSPPTRSPRAVPRSNAFRW